MANGVGRVELELHVRWADEIAFGPVQAMLLEEIRDAGSIAGAQRRLCASYAHVWKLVARMNAMFASPLVESVRGGSKGGGASLTRDGHTVLAAFRRLEAVVSTQGRAELLVIGEAARHATLHEA